MDIESGLVGCFVAVARTGSFTKAAEAMGIRQPQISIRIRKLEQSLGFQLFQRSTRHVVLTRDAEAFLPYAERIVFACEAAQSFASSLRKQRGSAMRVGSPGVSLNSPWRTEILSRFMDTYPNVQLDLQTAMSSDLMEKLVSMELDAVLTYRFLANGRSSLLPSAIEVTPVLHFHAALNVPIESDLAQRRQIRIEEMAGREVALSPGNACPDVIQDIQTQLERLSVRAVSAPEPYRATVIQFARTRHLPYFYWVEPHFSVEAVGPDRAVVQLADHPFELEFILMTRKGDQNRLTRRFRELAKGICDLKAPADAGSQVLVSAA